MRVLVADDDPSIRGMLEYTLGFEGFEVATAGDGETALESARALRPDVILLDVMMPRADGFAVATTLRAGEGTADIPIIMLTARAGDDDVLQGWRSGVDSYLTKPLDLALLFEEIHRVTSERLAGVA